MLIGSILEDKCTKIMPNLILIHTAYTLWVDVSYCLLKKISDYVGNSSIKVNNTSR